MKENWIINKKQNNNIKHSILSGRGIKDIDKFLHPDLHKLSRPEKLPNLIIAAKEIIKAVKNNCKIIIFGHDDVDGITSTILMYNCLTKLGSDKHDYYIPNRKYDKFGLQDNFINKVFEENYNLVITVDIGITEVSSISLLRKKGVNTIVIDHHNCVSDLPKALAIVNPMLPNSKARFKHLAGVGVVYNVVKYIEDSNGLLENNFDIYLTGIGTIADKVPLIDDNRIFATYLYNHFKKINNIFLNLFFKDNRNFLPKDLFKKLIILLTLGRQRYGEHLGIKILMCKQLNIVKKIYKTLLDRYKRNQEEIHFVENYIENKYQQDPMDNIFIYLDRDTKISINFLGVASIYILRKYRIPNIILTYWNNKIICGECRSPKGFDFIKALKNIDKYLIDYGGHKQAAGFSCYLKNFELIKKILLNLPDTYYDNKNKHRIYVDYSFDKDSVDLENLKHLCESFFPYGPDNPKLKFLLKNINMRKLEEISCRNLPELKENSTIDALVEYIINKEQYFSVVDYNLREQ